MKYVTLTTDGYITPDGTHVRRVLQPIEVIETAEANTQKPDSIDKRRDHLAESKRKFEEAQRKRQEEPLAVKDVLLCICALGVIGLILAVPCVLVWMALPDSFTDPIKYATIYQVDRSNVHIDQRPTNCDWNRAPLGDKDCYYKKVVTPFKDGSRVTSVFISWDRAEGTEPR